MRLLKLAILLSLVLSQICLAEDLWKITAYCSCEKCCGKRPSDLAYGIMANGKKAEYGYVACNWLPFGTLVDIDGMGIFTVGDRGTKSLFGDKNNHIKHLDIYMPSHEAARQFGVQYKKVTICGQEVTPEYPVMLTAQHRFVYVKPAEDFKYDK